ncbi:MAG: RluA family pseudouridine synthase [Deltaproteobacteria bacterium]|nr:RluA family pseudouridine synthase [Deltaproteobacteria bacterium]
MSDLRDQPASPAHNATTGETLAAALRRFAPERSWNNVRALCTSGKVFVDGERALDPAVRMQGGEAIEVRESAPRVRRHEYAELRVLHQDPHLIVVHKPPHLATSPHNKSSHAPTEEPTVLDALRQTVAKPSAARRKAGQQASLFVVHRLDKETSGVLCFARTKASERGLHDIFKRHQAQREYVAIVQGIISPQRIESELVRDRGDGIRGSAHEETKGTYRQHAVTHIISAEPLRGRHGMMTRIRLRLETGRTHQIRIHLSEAGHPVVGEAVYIRDLRERGDTPIPCPRLLLHAETLAFTHPITGEALSYVAEPPPSFVAALAGLLPAT